MRKKLQEHFENQIPEYANGQLNGIARRVFDLAARRDEKLRAQVAVFKQQRDTLKQQVQMDPSAAVLARIQNLAARQPQTAAVAADFPWRVWASGMIMIALALIFSWNALPPGNQLSWTIVGTDISTHYEIYRAPVKHGWNASDGEFVLVNQIVALDGVASYQYVDALLVPGQAYVYQVRSVGPAGNTISSAPLRVDASQAIIGQFALFATLAVGGFGLFLLTKIDPFPRIKRQYN
jgi:hypothetical protein